MSDRNPVGPTTHCSKPQDHAEHLCRLMEQGRTAEVLELSAHPGFRCGHCGAVANRADHLCHPGRL